MADGPKPVETYREVDLPDGSLGQYPLNWTDEAIIRDIHKNYPETRRLPGTEPRAPIQPEESYAPTARSLGVGTLRGLAAGADIVPRVVDWGARHLGYVPEGSPHPFSDIAESYGPAPVAGYEGTQAIGEVAGPVAVEAAAAPFTGGGSAAAIPATIAAGGARAVPRALARYGREAVTRFGSGMKNVALGTAGGVAGTEAAKEAGLGETGQDIAGGVSSLFAPSLAGQGLKRGFQRMLLSPESADTARAADVAGVHKSVGLIGNKFAGLLEDTMAGVPFGGGPSYTMRRQQYADMDAAAQRIAEAARGGPAIGEISQGSVGGDAQRAAREAVETNRAVSSGQQEALSQQVGPSRVVRDYPLFDRVRQLLNLNTRSSEVRDPLRARRDEMLRDRNQVVDPALDAQLNAWQQHIDNNTPAQGPLPPQLQQMQDFVDQMRHRNTGTTYGASKDLRSQTGRQLEGMVPLDAALFDPTYEAHTGVMRNAAMDAGIPPEVFDAIQADTRARMNENRQVLPLAEQTDRGSAYNQVLSPTKEQGTATLDILQRRAPQSTAEMLANNLELRTRDAAAGRQQPSPTTLKPQALSDWWNGLGPAERDAYAAPGTPHREQMDALATVAHADVVNRPSRTLPSGRGSSISIPAIMALQSTGLGHAMMSGDPMTALASISPTIIAHSLGTILTQPGVAEGLLRPPRPFLSAGQALPAIQAIRGYDQYQNQTREQP
jgi:hypothetical protein